MLFDFSNPNQLSKYFSYLFVLFSGYLILNFHLLSALLAGLAVHQLTTQSSLWMSQRLKLPSDNLIRKILILILSGVIVGLMTFSGLGLISFFNQESSNIQILFNKANEALSFLRSHLPYYIASILPTNIAHLKNTLNQDIHAHLAEIQATGKIALTNLVDIFLGMILGAMIALSETSNPNHPKPFTTALQERISIFTSSFRQIVVAQIKISLVNTTLSFIFLVLILPLMGAHLPLIQMLVILTFLLGLLPVIGNLISNTLIILISFSVAPWVAVISLIYLILIHKLEYFLNAKIVGKTIQAQSWEILLSMLVMETIFGFSGLILAPILYAYIKKELLLNEFI